MCACAVFALLELVVKIIGVAALISFASCQLPTNLQRAQMLEAHLRVREDVWPPASNMLLMEYSLEMEQLAAQWASRCEFEHPNSKVFPQYHWVGQNLAIFGGFTPTFTEAVCGYNAERKFYHYFNNSCTGVCGHYTQVRRTAHIYATHVAKHLHGVEQYMCACLMKSAKWRDLGK
ncbi:unnamed protein product [Hydatigera taeniaeformis]|uniref:SCP domain-containing protein n=1 Tax=Hydatigena taeniaeformis TaxID=6205 RepID=A0A0R3XDC0_HYDTA|nr:unnamed protein product [Hydatigera taeniaeformis]